MPSPASTAALFLLLGVALGPLSGCATIRKFNPIQSSIIESRRLTQQAEAAMHDANWAEAETQLAQAIERCPEDGHARYCLADVLWQRGATQAAAEQMAKSIELSPRPDPVALTRLGQMELSLGSLQSSMHHARQALELDNSQPDTWRLLGFALKEQGETQEAMDCFFRSLSLQSENARTRLEIAAIHRQRGEVARGLSMLANLSPNDSDELVSVCVLRAHLLRELSRPHDAVLALHQAIEEGDDRPETLFLLADTQLSAGEIAQANETLVRASESIDIIRNPLFQELQRRVELAMRRDGTLR